MDSVEREMARTYRAITGNEIDQTDGSELGCASSSASKKMGILKTWRKLDELGIKLLGWIDRVER